MRSVRIIARGLMLLSALPAGAAVFYATLEPDRLRMALALLAVLVIGSAAFVRPLARGLVVWAVTATAFTLWFVTDPPMNNRVWAPEYAIQTTWSRAGHLIHLRNIRNFVYHPDGNETAGYYDASYALDDLSGVDLVSSYWAGDAIAHTLLTFGFRDGRHLAFSIETRRQARFQYSAIAGFFHHFELFYVVADERDVLGARTDVRHERVYLYRLHVSASTRRTLFLSYLDKVQALATKPAWYNTIADNCTSGIMERANVGSSVRYDWRALLSGYTDHLAYDHGILDTSLPFEQLKERSLIRRPPGSVIDDSYSSDIRKALP